MEAAAALDPLAPSPATISSNFDSGAIGPYTLHQTPLTLIVSLELPLEKCLEGPETQNYFKQWFAFTVNNAPVTASFTITDAGTSTFRDWTGYKVCVSTDPTDDTTWKRVQSTTFSNGELKWSVTSNSASSLTFAYFPIYTLERQDSTLAAALATGCCTSRVLGFSVDERPLHALVFGQGEKDTDKVIWIQHRQHPGETSASWFCDGVIARLVELSKATPLPPLIANCKIIVVPNVNPDGSFRGHLRTNASGANLNRCWGRLHGLPAPQGQTTPPAPEVEAMVGAMKGVGGPDVMLDIHQDEEKPYVFISKTPLGCPSCTPELRKLREHFHEVLRARSVDFETPGAVDPVGYPEPAKGKANLNICSAAVAEAFPGCLSLTMEHPYKGNDNRGGE